MLQAANIDLLNPLVPKDHNSECQNILFFAPARINTPTLATLRSQFWLIA